MGFLWMYIKDIFSETTAAQDSRGVGCLIKPIRLVGKTGQTGLAKSSGSRLQKKSVIDQIKIQLLRLALCLLQVMGSVLWLKVRKRSQ
jgi:hypothetical protein